MISTDQYRACIGLFYANVQSRMTRTKIKSHFVFQNRTLTKIQYSSLVCSAFCVLSCSVSLYKLAMIVFLLLITSGSIHPNPVPRENLSVCHINARSLFAYDAELSSKRTKLDEIESVLSINFHYQIICINETWLSSSISNEDIGLNNSTLYRKDRDNGTSGYGGMAIYVANYLNSQRRFDLEVNGLEFICTEITVHNKSVLVSVCYRPPTNSGDARRAFLENFQVAIDKIKSYHSDIHVVLGDVNDRCISWYDNHASSELRLNVFDISTVNNLSQLINEPTRYSGNTASLLDLIFVNDDKFVTESGVKPPLLNLDRCTVFCHIKGILSTSCVIFSYPKLLSISVLTFIK
jgi:hypothetical protein